MKPTDGKYIFAKEIEKSKGTVIFYNGFIWEPGVLHSFEKLELKKSGITAHKVELDFSTSIKNKDEFDDFISEVSVKMVDYENLLA